MSVLSASECNSCGERTVLLTPDEFSANFCTHCGSDEMMYVDMTEVDISYQTVVQDNPSS
jgi:hypothetical protein